MTRPAIDRRANGIKLSWGDEKLQIALNNLDTHHGKNVSAFLVATTSNEEYSPHLLQAEFNLSALRTRQEFKRELNKRYPVEGINWDEIMEQVAVIGQQEAMKGSPAVDILADPDEIVPPPEYIFEPFIVKGQVNCLFGDGGCGKSELAAAFAVAMSGEWPDNPWRLHITPASCLVLDWETDDYTWKYRTNRLVRGMKRPATMIHYRHCFLPFAEDIAPIQNLIDYYAATVLIIDSVGVACGGSNLNETQTANGFFSALRMLNITSLLITHNSKGAGFGNDTKTAFGSSYFTTTPRNVWQVKKEAQEPGQTWANIALIDNKRNDFAYRHPIGFHLDYDDPAAQVRVKRIDLGDTELETNLPLRQRIKNLLSSGPRTVKEIAENLGAKPGTIHVTMARLKATSEVVALGDDKWGLAV